MNRAHHCGVPQRCGMAERAGAFLPGSGAFGEMVRMRLELAAAVGAWGLDLVLCDADTLWLRDPSDFFDMCAPRPRKAPSRRMTSAGQWPHRTHACAAHHTGQHGQERQSRSSDSGGPCHVTARHACRHPHADVLVASEALGTTCAESEEGLEQPAALLSPLSTGAARARARRPRRRLLHCLEAVRHSAKASGRTQCRGLACLVCEVRCDPSCGAPPAVSLTAMHGCAAARLLPFWQA
jgi:hypothetical protein